MFRVVVPLPIKSEWLNNAGNLTTKLHTGWQFVELDNTAIQASWDITSDSLAAWLAGVLSATELILVKSAIIDPRLSLPQLAKQNIVDKGFCDFVKQATFKIQIINQQNFY